VELSSKGWTWFQLFIRHPLSYYLSRLGAATALACSPYSGRVPFELVHTCMDAVALCPPAAPDMLALDYWSVKATAGGSSCPQLFSHVKNTVGGGSEPGELAVVLWRRILRPKSAVYCEVRSLPLGRLLSLLRTRGSGEVGKLPPPRYCKVRSLPVGRRMLIEVGRAAAAMLPLLLRIRARIALTTWCQQDIETTSTVLLPRSTLGAQNSPPQY
jgi:hypothetical protein